MKKVFFTIMLCAVSCTATFSQTSEIKKSTFQLSIVPPIGTNGRYSAEYTNDYSLNLFVGISKNEKKLTLGGFSNVILNNAKGFQGAGLFNYVGNKGDGFQTAGLVNINKGNFCGFQLAGLMNTAADITGVQYTGWVNIAKNIKGAQFAGVVNIAKDVKGAQFAGLVNIAKDVEGIQAGLVNIAENSDCPIGLINIIKNGEMGVAITYDGLGSTVASFRSGGKYTYGILGMGYNHKMKKNGKVVEAGLGAHIPVVDWFRINNEIKVSTIGCGSSEPVYNAGYSFLPAFKIGRHIELFGGASINFMGTKNMNAEDVLPNHSLWKEYSSTQMEQVSIGYQVGVQYIF